MPYKLVYFAVRGRGQAFKYMCADNGIAFEDEVVKDFAEWGKMKPNTLFGQLPILYDGSFEIPQSNAILRHVARKHDLYGKDETEKTLVDMLNDQQEDTRLAYLKLIYQQYEAEKDNFIKSIPEKLAVFEKMLGKNHGGSGFFVGTKQTFVDYTIFDLLDNFTVLSPGCLDGTPLLKAFHARMAAREKIAKIRASDAFKNMPINGNGKQ
jgi:glutathione S-transferase